MQIKDLSLLTGVSSATIRFYEKEGVLPKPKKGANGYRIYPEAQVEQLKMISRAKELGFTLKEIKELSKMLFSKSLSRKEMAERLGKKNLEIDKKIEALKAMKKEINDALGGNCEFKGKLT
ncbi:MAG: hypothetical protein CL677_02500 [Bdellovibrionaceae bacterium]|nr:hypothetical protein [Pseudobdellovibrionaceae bacterium]